MSQYTSLRNWRKKGEEEGREKGSLFPLSPYPLPILFWTPASLFMCQAPYTQCLHSSTISRIPLNKGVRLISHIVLQVYLLPFIVLGS